MRRIALPLLVGLALVAAACSTSRPERSGFTIPPAETSTTAAPAAPTPGSERGRLVVVGTDGAITTLLPDGTDVVTIVEASADTFVMQPQWSPVTGTLAWGSFGPGGGTVEFSDAAGGTRASTPTSGLPYYLSWSPDGTGLVSLYDGAAGGVEARYIEPASGDTVVLGTASPYYFSWSPGSDRIATHTGTTAFDIVQLDGTAAALGEASPFFQAPAWTQAGIFHLTTAGIERDDGTGSSQLLARVPGPVFFSANRSGTKLAVQPVVAGQAGSSVALLQVPELAANVISVIDTVTGEVDVATDVPAAAFFWSPDGESLAILVDGRGPGEIQWVLWRDGDATALASFVPPPSFVTGVLPFASQYALSLNLWSPGSTALAFAGLIDGERGIWVQPVDGSPPALIADGEWVAWSYE